MPAKKKTRKKRTRFGFALDPKLPRDQVVVEWINSQPNASEAVKSLIYAAATGQASYAIPTPQIANEATGDLDLTDPRVKALAGALDT